MVKKKPIKKSKKNTFFQLINYKLFNRKRVAESVYVWTTVVKVIIITVVAIGYVLFWIMVLMTLPIFK